MENKEVRLIDANACPCNECRRQWCELPHLCTNFGLWLRRTIDTESLRQQWHDAETDPPKEPMEYIAMIKGGANATTLLYDGGLWFEEDEEGWQTYYKVTHWMPFPKPPKKGD